jgi:hypothetical protein
VFRVNHPGAPGGDGMTQFGWAVHALNIDIICANSSQAKSLPWPPAFAVTDNLICALFGPDAQPAGKGGSDL